MCVDSGGSKCALAAAGIRISLPHFVSRHYRSVEGMCSKQGQLQQKATPPPPPPKFPPQKNCSGEREREREEQLASFPKPKASRHKGTEEKNKPFKKLEPLTNTREKNKRNDDPFFPFLQNQCGRDRDARSRRHRNRGKRKRTKKGIKRNIDPLLLLFLSPPFWEG